MIKVNPLDGGLLAVASCNAPTRHHQRVAINEIVDRLVAEGVFPVEGCLTRSVSGRPFLPSAPHLHISITHSGHWAALAVSSRPIGIDVETRSAIASEALELFASKMELDILSAVRIWSIKEAALKCIEAAGDVPMREVEVDTRSVVVPGHPYLRWSAWQCPPFPEVIIVVPEGPGG